jgi:hypothetical protein
MYNIPPGDIEFRGVRVLIFRYSYETQFSREEGKVDGRYAGPGATSFSNSPSELLARGIRQV